MGTILVPYSQAMRLGQGYNTYLQQICINRAVTFGKNAIQFGILTSIDDIPVTPSSDHASIAQEASPQLRPEEKPQTVTYKTAFVDKLSDLVEILNISAAAGIRNGTLQADANATYVNENKFKESNINFIINVKVVHDKTELNEDLLTFNGIPSVMEDHNTFTEHYGDGFISGFIDGGELNGIVNIKLLDKADITHVKASLQAAATIVAAEGQRGYLTSVASKAAETNISINWSGGGQVKEPNVEWNISNLLKAAAAFPSHVAKCPQRTWAIITKYKHLRSYVEKVNKPTIIEYEMAASYTSSLLDNFIEYKLMLKTIADIMENAGDYEKSPAPDAFALGAASLVKARFEVQREIAKLVLRVNDINADPKKALELVQDPLPAGVSSITDSHIYSARLPSKALPPPLALNPVAQPANPTPRSENDVITFNTNEMRAWQNPAANDFKVLKFDTARGQPPQFATGINYMDLSKGYRYRLNAEVTKITTTEYQVNLNSWGDSTKYCAGMTWFEVTQHDPDFQQGRVGTYIPGSNSYPTESQIMSIVKFPHTYTEDVEVLVWLTHINVDGGKAGFLSIDTYIKNLECNGFELWYGTKRASHYINSLGYCWIAYPKKKQGVESGWIHKQKGTTRSYTPTTTVVQLFKKSFMRPPRVWIAFSGIEVEKTDIDNLRVITEVLSESVTTTGFKYDVSYWCQAVLLSASVCWIAVEVD